MHLKEKNLVDERSNTVYFEFVLCIDGEENAFVRIDNGIITSAGYYGCTKDHDYFNGKPNWNMVAEIMYLFSVYGRSDFIQIKFLLNENSEEFQSLKRSCSHFIQKNQLDANCKII